MNASLSEKKLQTLIQGGHKQANQSFDNEAKDETYGI